MSIHRIGLAGLLSVALLAGASAAEPRVVNGCRIEPATNCAFARLEAADLAGADLSDASLHGAVMTGANLRGANL